MVFSLQSLRHVLSSVFVNKPIVSTHLKLHTRWRPKQETDSRRTRRRCEQRCFRCIFLVLWLCLSFLHICPFFKVLFFCVGRAEKPPAYWIKKRSKNTTAALNITAFTIICVPVIYSQNGKFKGKGQMLGVLWLLLLCSFGWFRSSLSILSSWLCVRFFGNGCRMDFWLTVLSDGLSELWAFWNGRHECVIGKKYFFT